MGEKRTIEATDGTKIDAWQARPSGTPKAGIVVIQEIFGVNNHIRNVTDRFAADGYLALAPAVFDRRKKDVDLGYTPDGIAQGREIAMSLKVDEFMAAEPRMEQRKQTGVKVILFLLVLAGLMYLVKRKVWANVPH